MTTDSYDLNNRVRDVNEAFELILSDPYSLTSLFPLIGGVTNTKHEWLEDSLDQTKSDITALTTDGDGKSFVVTSNVGFEVGSIIRFESATGQGYTEQAQVASINVDGVTMVIPRDYASSTGVALQVGDFIILLSTPKLEHSLTGSGTIHQVVATFNYTEIFDEHAELSGTAMSSDTYDNYNKLVKQEAISMLKIKRKIANAIMHGRKVIRTSSVQGTMGGLIQYIVAGGNTSAVGAAISETVLNNAFEAILQKGGASGSDLAMIVPANQARRITALNISASNPVITKTDSPSQRLGNFVTTFVSSLPVLNGLGARIMIDYTMPKDQIILVDTSKVSLRQMRAMTSKDATVNGEDGQRTRLLTEMTLEIKNAAQAHYMLTTLTV